jgi:hypothetical protein
VKSLSGRKLATHAAAVLAAINRIYNEIATMSEFAQSDATVTATRTTKKHTDNTTGDAVLDRQADPIVCSLPKLEFDPALPNDLGQLGDEDIDHLQKFNASLQNVVGNASLITK